MRDWRGCDPLAIARNTVAQFVASFDPASVDESRAAALVELFSGLERFAVAGRTLAAGRVADSCLWRDAGERSAADWLARRTGVTVGAARATVETAARLSSCPRTDAAFRRGGLTFAQVEAITAAVVADPSAEPGLLAVAACQGLGKLREACARARAAADPDPDETHAQVRRTRSWRRWTDASGARCGTYRLSPEDGAVLEAAAQPFIDLAFSTARDAGVREPAAAYAADGLVAMAASTMTATRDDERGERDERDDESPTAEPGGGPDDGAPGGGTDDAPGGRSDAGSRRRRRRSGRGRQRTARRRELIGLVNLESLRRGSVEPGELCEIAGVGPVPLAVARDVFGDALLRIVIRDGSDIRTVVHTGHTASTLQETAVLVRDGGRCVRPTCSAPITEIDHVEDYHYTRRTTLDELAGLCAADHDNKTYGGHRYWRGDRGWEWHPPNAAPVEYEHPPP
jgi:hypothetical protein